MRTFEEEAAEFFDIWHKDIVARDKEAHANARPAPPPPERGSEMVFHLEPVKPNLDWMPTAPQTGTTPPLTCPSTSRQLQLDFVTPITACPTITDPVPNSTVVLTWDGTAFWSFTDTDGNVFTVDCSNGPPFTEALNIYSPTGALWFSGNSLDGVHFPTNGNNCAAGPAFAAGSGGSLKLAVL